MWSTSKMSKVENNEENREKLAEAVVESMEMKDMIQAGLRSQIRYGIGKEPGDYIRNTLTNWSTQTNWVLTAWC